MTRSRTLRGGQKPILLGSKNGLPEYYYSGKVESCVDELHKGPPYKTGGPCTITKTVYFAQPSRNVDLFGIGSPRRTYVGRFVPVRYTSVSESTPGLPSSTIAGSEAMATKAWSKYRPGNPVSSSGQFLGEVNKLPTIPLIQSLRKKATFFRRLGSEYLNGAFGWAPFVRDVKDMAFACVQMDKHLAQLRRDNGRLVRRRGRIGVEQTQTSGTVTDALRPGLTSEFYVSLSTPVATWTDTTTITHGFSGAFRYWIPDIDTPTGERRAIKRLLGLNLTPALVYELTPWSWLIDYVSNVGNVITNLSQNAAENLVAEYAYGTSRREREVMLSVKRMLRYENPLGGNVEVSCASGFRQKTYIRSVANPYGFGLTYADLTGRQMLILAALGLSRHS